jgi:predicted N-acetyltransferase YhbS
LLAFSGNSLIVVGRRKEHPLWPAHRPTTLSLAWDHRAPKYPNAMDMLVKLYDLPDSRASFERLRQEGIQTRRALTAEKHKVAAWVRENFAEGWASETEVAFARQPVSCFIAVKEGRIVGFACHDATCRNFFGPTGVDPKARKQGVGTALLFACLEDMRQQGFGYAIIGGVGPVAYYSKVVGAVPSRARSPGSIEGCLIARVFDRATQAQTCGKGGVALTPFKRRRNARPQAKAGAPVRFKGRGMMKVGRVSAGNPAAQRGAMPGNSLPCQQPMGEAFSNGPAAPFGASLSPPTMVQP